MPRSARIPNTELRTPPRRGLTLIELMISIAVTTILVGTISVLASTVEQAATFNGGQTDALQHARVALDRIQRTVNEAYATETYPGVVVVDETVGSHRYPDTLVVWHPSTGTPANPNGPPLVKELVIICPNPTNTGELIEVTALNDTRTVALNEAGLNTTLGRSFISGIKTSNSSTKTQLTPLLRSASASTSTNGMRGCVRFECELHPTATELANFRSGSATWSSLGWPQDMTSAAFGTRQVWLRSEVQLLSEPRKSDGSMTTTTVPLPFFGSTTLYYTIKK